MKTLFASFNYFDGISLTRNDANYCSHSGACDNEVKEISEKPYVKKQLAKIDKKQLKKELYNYGAWDEKELSNHKDNLQRILWIAAGNIVENQEAAEYSKSLKALSKIPIKEVSALTPTKNKYPKFY